MKIHVVQKHITNKDLKPFIRRAEDAGADLVCFNELATTGCLYEPQEVDSLDLVLDSLNEFDIRIMTGMPYITEVRAYNSYLYYHRGDYQFYHKRNLFPDFGETKMYQPGKLPGVFDSDLGKLGAAICYDIRFGTVFEDLARQKVEKVFIPAAFPRERVDQWREMVINRALEMHVPVVGINPVGNDGTIEFGGISLVVDGNGKVLAEADQTSETVLEVTL